MTHSKVPNSQNANEGGQKNTLETKLPFISRQEDVDFIADCKEAELSKKNPWAKVIIYAVLGFFVVFLIWAYFAEIDEVTVANGNVIPSSRMQVIQSLDGGIVEKIYVKKGELVKKDQILAQFDLIRYTAEYQAALGRSQALEAALARLTAQAEGKKEITFPAKLAANRPDLIAEQKTLFAQRRQTYFAELAALKKAAEIGQSEINIMRPLVKEGLMSQLELLKLERQANELNGQIEKLEHNNREDALSQIDKIKAELESTQETAVSLKDRMEKATLRSPVDGIVNAVDVHTVGGVVPPGGKLMEIVPLNEQLLVEAKLLPSQVAFISLGQPAQVKITAYDYSIYGGLEGKVVGISPDTIADEKGDLYFHVLVKTDKNYLTYQGKQLPITPGMMASVHIMTGKHSVMQYLLKPIIKAKSNALQER